MDSRIRNIMYMVKTKLDMQKEIIREMGKDLKKLLFV